MSTQNNQTQESTVISTTPHPTQQIIKPNHKQTNNHPQTAITNPKQTKITNQLGNLQQTKKQTTINPPKLKQTTNAIQTINRNYTCNWKTKSPKLNNQNNR